MKRIAYTAAAMMAAALLLHAQHLGPADVERLPASPVTATASYGPAPLQQGDLRLPAGKGPFPVVVVIHGGCWTRGFATRNGIAAVASALTAHGYATWNIDYRQVGDAGGGWPGTFTDWAAATDYLRTLAKTQPLDLSRVTVVGHSAGGYAALWLASRTKLNSASKIRGTNPLPIFSAVNIDGPGELTPFIGMDAEVCGLPVIVPLMGGTPKEVPQRYKDAQPLDNPMPATKEFLIASYVLLSDDAERYRTKAAKLGAKVEVLEIKNGGHFDIIAPGTAAWEQVEPELLKALR